MANTNKNKLYNFIVNTYGLSKVTVVDMINDRIEELFLKVIKDKLDSKDSEKMILNQITQLVQEGITKNNGYMSWWEKTKFEDYVKKVMTQILEKKVNDEYNLEVKLVRKDKTVIAKF